MVLENIETELIRANKTAYYILNLEKKSDWYYVVKKAENQVLNGH